jgi:DNA-binding MarR family transcriptional regulator
MQSSAKAPATDANVIETVRVLSDFMRFLVRLPHSHGLSLAELGVLNALGRNGAMRISNLAIEQDMTQPGMTQLVTRMERAGLVSRQADPSDGRAVLVAATETGQQVFHTRDESRVALFAELYEDLDETERRRLREALPVLTRLMQIKEANADGLSR